MAGKAKSEDFQELQVWKDGQLPRQCDKPDTKEEAPIYLPSSTLSEAESLNRKEYLSKLRSTDDPALLVSITKHIVSCFSKQPITTRDELIASGLVPRLVEFLSKDDNSVLQFNTACILQDIAGGTSQQAMLIVECGAIDKLARLMHSKVEHVQSQAILALAQIADEHIECNKLVMKEGILTHVLQVLRTSKSLSVIKAAAWCLCALCQGELPEGSDTIVLLVANVLLYHNNTDIRQHATWSVADLLLNADGTTKDARIETVMQKGIGKSIVNLITDPNESIASAALTAVGEITLVDTFLQQVIDCSVLPKLLEVLEDGNNPQLRKMACQTIGNITAGFEEHILAVLDAYVFPSLMCILDSKEALLLQDAAVAIYNSTVELDGTEEHIQAMVQMGMVESLCDLLSMHDNNILKLALDTLYNILRMEHRQGKQNTVVKMRRQSADTVLQGMLTHHMGAIRRRVTRILRFLQT